MRVFLVSLAALAAGTLIGIGYSLASYTPAAKLDEHSLFGPDGAAEGGAVTPARGEGPPRIVVDQEEYDFGALERNEAGSHTFVVSNRGASPLEIELLDISCSCTSSDLAKGKKVVIEPGDSYDVVLRWHARAQDTRFRQAATLGTNDPGRDQVHLVISGKVIEGVKLDPEVVNVDKVDVSRGARTHFEVVSFKRDDLKVVDYRWADPTAAYVFQIRLGKIHPKDLKQPGAKSGVHVGVRVVPGLNLGAFEERLILKTNDPTHPELTATLRGRVEGPVAISGPGFVAKFNMLVLGGVRQSEGRTAKLLLKITGKLDEPVSVRAEKVVPDYLQATFGEPQQVVAGEHPIVHVPLTVVIPPGAPLENHLGTEEGPMGMVLIKTNHPLAKTMRMDVQFAIEK